MKPNAARRLANHAIRKGELVRPMECSRCGIIPAPTSDGRAAIQAHHHDYDKPLDVEWLCAKCHRAETPLPEVMGGKVFGEKNGQSRLTESEVRSARRLRAQGLSYQAIASRLGVHKMTVMRACKGESWPHVAAAPAQGGDA